MPILLDVHGLAAAQNVQGISKRELHDMARNALNAFASADYAGPVNLDDLFPWKSYLAFHAQEKMLTGPGSAVQSLTSSQTPEIQTEVIVLARTSVLLE